TDSPKRNGDHISKKNRLPTYGTSFSKNRDHHFRSSKTHACLSIDRPVFPWTNTLTTISSCHSLLIAITHSKNHQTNEQRTTNLSLAMADITNENPRK